MSLNMGTKIGPSVPICFFLNKVSISFTILEKKKIYIYSPFFGKKDKKIDNWIDKDITQISLDINCRDKVKS